MIDLKQLRHDPERFRQAVRDRTAPVSVDEILALDVKHRDLERQVQGYRQRLRARSQRKPTAADIKRLKRLGEELRAIEVQAREMAVQLQRLLERFPNVPSADTPVGSGPEGNVVLRVVGDQPKFSFPPLPHWELGDGLDMMDSQRAAAVSGSRLVYLKRELVWLQFALIQYALAAVTDQATLERIARRAQLVVSPRPFVPVLPPVFIRPEMLQKMARLEPKEERYHLERDDQYLIGSAEHTLGPLHAGETLAEGALPVRYVGYSTCFRREAGSYGKDTKGLIRLHQFDKVELASFCAPETSMAEHDFMVAIQEHLVQGLGLPYRVVQMCTGDLALPDARQIDLEVWFPGMQTYKETHTADLNTDYQSRRLQIRVKRATGVTELVHMNDATAVALGRTLAAVVENYQAADGSVRLPKVLRPYLPRSLDSLRARAVAGA